MLRYEVNNNIIIFLKYSAAMAIILIAAMTKGKHVIGKNNKLPWSIPEELEKFRGFTKGNTVIMGRRTFESVGSKPLPNRNNIVVSASLQPQKSVEVARTIKEAIEKAKSYVKDIYIIGGAKIYEQSFQYADKMYISYIKEEYDGDTFFPEFSEADWEIERKEDYKDFEFVVYRRRI